MKNTIKSILSTVLCLVVLISCSSDKEGSNAHSHNSDEWIAEATGHYQMCESEDKKVNEGKHRLDNDNICYDCGAYVAARSSVEVVVTTKNEFGLTEKRTVYRKLKPIYTETYTYEFNNSVPVAYTLHEDDTLLEEGKIALSSIGEYYISERKAYDTDGEYIVSVYNDKTHSRSTIEYSANGDVIEENLYENTYSESGALVSSSCYTDGVLTYERAYTEISDGKLILTTETHYNSDGTKIIYTCNEYGDTVYDVLYDENGEVLDTYTYEYTYDADGNPILCKSYCDSEITYEEEYSYVTYDYPYRKTYISKITQYDGECKLITLYDEDDLRLSETLYDEDGKELDTYTYKYTFDEYAM